MILSARLVISLIVLGVLTRVVPPAHAQPLRDEKGYAIVFPRNGEGFAANILRSDPDTLVVFTNDIEYVAKKDIEKIVFHPNRRSNRGLLVGSILGMYAANFVLGTAERQPGAFLSTSLYGQGYSGGPAPDLTGSLNTGSSLAVAGIAIVGTLVGGTIGWLSDRQSDDTKTFYFSADKAEAANGWAAFDDILVESKVNRPFRLTLSGASVFTRIARAYRTQALDAGLTINNYISNSGPQVEFEPFGFGPVTESIAQDASDFNWGRSIALSYAVRPNIEVGVQWSWLSEPTFGASYGQILASEPDPFITLLRTFTERLDAKGYYATASYIRSVPVSREHDVEFRLTAGVGLAKIDFNAHGEMRIDSSDIAVIDHIYDVSVHKLYFSALGSLEVSYYVCDLFSLGLEASYYYAGSGTAPEMPYIFFKEQPLHFGNADIGFTIGLHL